MILRFMLLLLALSGPAWTQLSASPAAGPVADILPVPLESYAPDEAGATLWQVLRHRITAEPLNLAASLIFLLAVVHTFLTARFRHWAHEVELAHGQARQERRELQPDPDEDGWWIQRWQKDTARLRFGPFVGSCGSLSPSQSTPLWNWSGSRSSCC